jgi:hypothetical protein
MISIRHKLKSMMATARQRAGLSYIRVMNCYFTVAGSAKKCFTIISNCAASIFGLFILFILYMPLAQSVVGKISNLDAIFLAIGGLIGTILALVISLSIIPIQAAAESFSSSIIRLYREDKVTRYIFALLSIFCLISFLMAIGEAFGYAKAVLLPIAILFVAMSIDLLRWHHRHITNLLGSNDAISQLSSTVKSYLDKTCKNIAFWARFKWMFLPKAEQDKLPVKAMEQFLSQQSYNIGPLKIWLNEFAEVAHKAIVKQEVLRAQLAIFAMADIACYFLDKRKDNLRIYAETEALGLVLGSDVNDILTPIYEHYRNISRNAIDKKVETAAICVVQALGKISIHITNLKSPAFHKNTAPLTYLPVGYLSTCVEMAQIEKMNDVALQGANILLDVVKASPVNVDIADVHLTILKELTKIAVEFLAKGNVALSNHVITNIMTVGHIAVAGKHFNVDAIMKQLLDYIYSLLVGAVTQQRLAPATFLNLPLTPPYDLTQEVSLGYLVARAQDLIEKPDEEKHWINPYSDFIELNESITRHLYKIGEQIDFGPNFLLWHIIHTIMHISKIFFSLLQKPITDNSDHIKELKDCFKWYLSFFWLVFSNKKTFIELTFAEEATDGLAVIGMLFYSIDHKDITQMCIDNIASIAESYQEIAKPNSLPQAAFSFNIVDVIMPLWQVRILMEAKTDADFLNKIDNKLAVFLKGRVMSLVGVEPLETRKRQLQRQLQEELHFSQWEKAVGVLQQLLKPNDVKNDTD